MQMRSTVKRITKNFIYNAAYQLYTVLIPLITVPYLSRALGVDGVGIASYSQSITNYFVLFASLGMATYGTREIARDYSANKDVSNKFSSLVFFQFFSTLIVSVAYAAYLTTNEDGILSVQGLWFPWIVSVCFDISWLFFGMEMFRYPTIRNFIIKTLQLFFILLFVKDSNDVNLYVAICSFSFLFSQLLLWPKALKMIRLKKVTISNVVEHLKPNLLLLLPVIGISLYTLLDKIMLGLMCGPDAVGLYEYSERICKMPLSIITALGTVMLPYMSGLLLSESKSAEHVSEKIIESISNSLFVMGFMSFAIASIVFSSADLIAHVFFGPGFERSDTLLRMLVWIIPIISVCNVLGTHYILPKGNDSGYTIAIFAGAFVNVILNIVLIPRIGAIGTALATLVAEFAVLLVEVCLVASRLPLKQYFRNQIPFIISSVCTILIMQMLVKLFEYSWLSLLLSIGASVAIYVSITIIFLLLTQKKKVLSLISSYFDK